MESPQQLPHFDWTLECTPLDRPPVVDARGGSYVVGLRGDVVALSPEGIERWRVATGAAQPGPATLLADDTLVFADVAGEAIAVRDGSVLWKKRFARPDADNPSPLPLDDGGAVVATTRELAVLDAEGNDDPRAEGRPSKIPLSIDQCRLRLERRPIRSRRKLR